MYKPKHISPAEFQQAKALMNGPNFSFRDTTWKALKGITGISPISEMIVSDGKTIFRDQTGWYSHEKKDGYDFRNMFEDVVLMNLDRKLQARDRKRWVSFFSEMYEGKRVYFREATSASRIERRSKEERWRPFAIHVLHEPCLKPERRALAALALLKWTCITPYDELLWQPTREGGPM